MTECPEVEPKRLEGQTGEESVCMWGGGGDCLSKGTFQMRHDLMVTCRTPWDPGDSPCESSHLRAPGKPMGAVTLWLAVAEEGEEHLTVGFVLHP